MLNSEFGYYRKCGFIYIYVYYWCKILIIFYYGIKRVCYSCLIKLFIWVLFMFLVEGYIEY